MLHLKIMMLMLYRGKVKCYMCSGVGAAAAAVAMAAALLRQLGEVEGHCTCAVAPNQLQLLD